MTKVTSSRRPCPHWQAGVLSVLMLAFAAAGGCQAVGFFADAAYRAGDHEVKAKYTGLEGKTFAVVVAADRAIQADFPNAVPLITREVSRRIAEGAPIKPAGVASPDDILRFQYQRPGWVAMTLSDLTQALGVERLVFIDLQEFALTEPGNPYLWAGQASAIVGVVEADSGLGSDFAFREFITVKFPDKDSVSPQEMPGETVELELMRRFVNRAAWLFFDHREKNIIEY